MKHTTSGCAYSYVTQPGTPPRVILAQQLAATAQLRRPKIMRNVHLAVFADCPRSKRFLCGAASERGVVIGKGKFPSFYP